MNSREKHDFAVRVVIATHTLKGIQWLPHDDSTFQNKHDLVSAHHAAVSGTPAVVLFKEDPQEVTGVKCHGWDAQRIQLMLDEMSNTKSTQEGAWDYRLFIVDYKNGSVYTQTLRKLNEKHTYKNIEFPYIETSKGTPLKIYWAIRDFEVFAGIPNEYFEEYYEKLQAKRQDLFSGATRVNPLLDAISNADTFGHSITIAIERGGNRENDKVIITAKKGKYVGSWYVDKAWQCSDADIINAIQEAVMEAAEHRVYILLPKGEYQSLKGLFAEPMLSNKIRSSGFPTVFKALEAGGHNGDILRARVVKRKPLLTYANIEPYKV